MKYTHLSYIHLFILPLTLIGLGVCVESKSPSFSIQGTYAAEITDVIDAADGKDIYITGGQLTFTSKTDESNAISLSTNNGQNETIEITNNQGTSESSIKLESIAGGLDGGP